LLAIAAVLAIVGTASVVHPVFLDSTPIARHMEATDSSGPQETRAASLSAPWLTAPAEEAVQSEQFRVDREAFTLDLIRTGRITPMRARAIADVAVREAYRQRIPPALVLGVMLTENDAFKPTARSKVGAVGLMQIYGRLWRNSLGRMYGTDLHDDATNLRYGIHILRYMSRAVPDSLGPEDGWRRALLGYNGCVRGRNTPNCSRYPDVVREHVDRAAKATCGGQDFSSCVAQPLWIAVRDDRLSHASD
jgi:soluble lytic murein transglycosylase-like protein